MSALIKSMRGSDADICVLACAVARRRRATNRYRTTIDRLASEDVGNADPRALDIAVACAQAVHWVGMPEARIPLAQTVLWLATCPKSNASYPRSTKQWP